MYFNLDYIDYIGFQEHGFRANWNTVIQHIRKTFRTTSSFKERRLRPCAPRPRKVVTNNIRSNEIRYDKIS